MKARGPALGMLELESIARGIRTADSLVKRAPVEIVRAEPVTPGKYALLFFGNVAEAEESFRAGVETAGDTLIDKLFLPYAHPGLVRGLANTFTPTFGESIGIVETQTIASALFAADTALKQAEVWLKALHLARGIGGKGYFVFTGALHMVEEAVRASAAAIEPTLLVSTELIERPHPELIGSVL